MNFTVVYTYSRYESTTGALCRLSTETSIQASILCLFSLSMLFVSIVAIFIAAFIIVIIIVVVDVDVDVDVRLGHRLDGGWW